MMEEKRGEVTGREKQNEKTKFVRADERKISRGREHARFFAYRGETGCLDTAERDSSLKLTLERTAERKRMRMGRRYGER